MFGIGRRRRNRDLRSGPGIMHKPSAFAVLLVCGLLSATPKSGTALAQDTVPEAPPLPPPAEALEVEPAGVAENATAATTAVEEPAEVEAPDADAQPAEVEAPDADAQPAETALPARTLAELDRLRLIFGAGSAELSEDVKADLLALFGYLENNRTVRVELLAYATAADSLGSRARWLSLSRALAVRGFLVDKGVPIARIDVRPLGSEVMDGPPDRVDVVPARR